MSEKSESNDYYDVLDVERGADATAIKAAYKRMAVKHHPDKGGNEEAFKRVAEAYDVLSNVEKRRMYDAGVYNPSMPGRTARPGHGVDPRELFQQFFAGNRGFFGEGDIFMNDIFSSAGGGGGIQVQMNMSGMAMPGMTSVSTSTHMVGNVKVTREVKTTGNVREETLTETNMTTGMTKQHTRRGSIASPSPGSMPQTFQVFLGGH